MLDNPFLLAGIGLFLSLIVWISSKSSTIAFVALVFVVLILYYRFFATKKDSKTLETDISPFSPIDSSKPSVPYKLTKRAKYPLKSSLKDGLETSQNSQPAISKEYSYMPAIREEISEGSKISLSSYLEALDIEIPDEFLDRMLGLLQEHLRRFVESHEKNLKSLLKILKAFNHPDYASMESLLTFRCERTVLFDRSMTILEFLEFLRTTPVDKTVLESFRSSLMEISLPGNRFEISRLRSIFEKMTSMAKFSRSKVTSSSKFISEGEIWMQMFCSRTNRVLGLEVLERLDSKEYAPFFCRDEAEAQSLIQTFSTSTSPYRRKRYIGIYRENAVGSRSHFNLVRFREKKSLWIEEEDRNSSANAIRCMLVFLMEVFRNDVNNRVVPLGPPGSMNLLLRHYWMSLLECSDETLLPDRINDYIPGFWER